MNMTLGERIRKARKSRGLTQFELAEAVGVHEMTIRRWESDNTAPNVAMLQKIANVLSVPLIELTGDEPPAQNLPINNVINNAPKVSNDDLDLGYWGDVAERASRAARSGDKKKIALITPLLRSALEAITGEESEMALTERTAVGVRGYNNNVRLRDINMN